MIVNMSGISINSDSSHISDSDTHSDCVVEPYALHTEPILTTDRSHILNIIAKLKHEMNCTHSVEVSSDITKDTA